MGIRIEGLDVTYGHHRVIEGLALAIEPGSFFTLLGPSGCGKTTLLRTIAGFIEASAGKILFGGSDVTRLPAHRRNIGMVFQDYALFPDKTVNDNVAYGLKARREDGASIRRKVGEALERVGLGHLGERHPAALSGGQRQRVALARALTTDAPVLVVRDPTTAVDSVTEARIARSIRDLRHGRTTVFVTTSPSLLAACDRVVVVAGQVTADGTHASLAGLPAYREAVLR